MEVKLTGDNVEQGVDSGRQELALRQGRPIDSIYQAR